MPAIKILLLPGASGITLPSDEMSDDRELAPMTPIYHFWLRRDHVFVELATADMAAERRASVEDVPLGSRVA